MSIAEIVRMNRSAHMREIASNRKRKCPDCGKALPRHSCRKCVDCRHPLHPRRRKEAA